MIYDKIENAKQYAGINERIDTALELVKQYTPDNYPLGKLNVDGDNLYLIFNDYETHFKDDAVLEAHRKYIDVMYMVEGTETIYVKPTDDLNTIIKEYDESIEALLAKLDDDASAVTLKKGEFIVLFPQDAHAPGCIADTKATVKKIVAKIAI